MSNRLLVGGEEPTQRHWDIPVNSENHCKRRLSLEPDISRLIAVRLGEDGDPFVHWYLHLAEPIPLAAFIANARESERAATFAADSVYAEEKLAREEP